MSKPMNEAEEIAATLTRDRLGVRFGVLHFWGLMPVQPNDFNYELQSAAAEGDRVDLGLIGPDGVVTVLAVHAPRGCTLPEGAAEIASATRITWGSWDCHLEGQTLHVRGGSADASARPRHPGDPALRLKVA